MYENVAKRLRWLAFNFPHTDEPKDESDKICNCINLYCTEAAHAIEELQKAVNFHKFNSEFWEDKYNSLADEKWIPVTEALPEESEGLNWHEDMTIRFTSVWCCDAKTGTIEVRNRLQGKKTGIKCLDQHTKDTDWHWSKSWWEPTHWMPIVPLPDTPKEET